MIDNGEEDDAGLAFNVGQDTLQLFGGADQGIDVFDRFVISFVQETLVEAYRRLNEYLRDPKIPFLKWLILLADQQVRTARRRHIYTSMRSTEREDQNIEVIKEQNISDDRGPAKNLMAIERRERLFAAIETLDTDSQQIIKLRYLEEKPLAEVATILNLSLDATAKRAMRSLARLVQAAKGMRAGDSSN